MSRSQKVESENKSQVTAGQVRDLGLTHGKFLGMNGEDE